MKQNNLRDVAIKYCVEDLSESLILATAFATVLNRLELAPDFIPEATKSYLTEPKFIEMGTFLCRILRSVGKSPKVLP
jgi:hypothetical protein